jgi:hypothetical protein
MYGSPTFGFHEAVDLEIAGQEHSRTGSKSTTRKKLFLLGGESANTMDSTP